MKSNWFFLTSQPNGSRFHVWGKIVKCVQLQLFTRNRLLFCQWILYLSLPFERKSWNFCRFIAIFEILNRKCSTMFSNTKTEIVYFSYDCSKATQHCVFLIYSNKSIYRCKYMDTQRFISFQGIYSNIYCKLLLDIVL